MYTLSINLISGTEIIVKSPYVGALEALATNLECNKTEEVGIGQNSHNVIWLGGCRTLRVTIPQGFIESTALV